jgi:hypothetical protein
MWELRQRDLREQDASDPGHLQRDGSSREISRNNPSVSPLVFLFFSFPNSVT